MTKEERERYDAAMEAVQTATVTMEEFGKAMVEASTAFREFMRSMKEEQPDG